MSRPILFDGRGIKRISFPVTDVPLAGAGTKDVIVPIIRGADIGEHLFSYIYWTPLSGGGASSNLRMRMSARWTEHPTLGNFDGAGAAVADGDAVNAYRYFTDHASGAQVGMQPISATGASVAAGGKYRTLSFINTAAPPTGFISSPFVALCFDVASQVYSGGTVLVEYIVC